MSKLPEKPTKEEEIQKAIEQHQQSMIAEGYVKLPDENTLSDILHEIESCDDYFERAAALRNRIITID